MVAMSGLPTALYGVEATPFSDGRIKQLRSAAFFAVWQSSNRAAREAYYGLLVPWRADPLAVATVRPLVQMHVALNEGLLTPRQLKGLMEHPEKVGPVAAFSDALRRAGLEYLAEDRVRKGSRTILLRTTPHKQLERVIVWIFFEFPSVYF